ncbi:MAG: arginase family protein, partial [Candidatus Angelobacter sp.]
MATFPYPDCKFELSHRLALESNDDKAAVIFDTESRTRMKVSRALYALMLEFKSPCRLDEVLDQKQLQSLQPLLERLLDAGFLVDIKKQRLPLPKPEVRLAPVFPTMFQAPLHETGQPPSDVAIVGVPYDGGNMVDPGMRHAPHEMRRRSCSQEYRLDCLTGKPKGWFDAGNNERILEGVTISDWGDLRFTYGEAPEVIYKRLGAVCADIFRQGSFPAFIGGDHSIS